MEEDGSRTSPFQLQGDSDGSSPGTETQDFSSKGKPAASGESGGRKTRSKEKRESEKNNGKDSRSLFSDSVSEEKEKEGKGESEPSRPLLKVKSFARMLDENVLKETEEDIADNGTDKSVEIINEYEVETDDNTEGEEKKEEEKKEHKLEEKKEEEKKEHKLEEKKAEGSSEEEKKDKSEKESEKNKNNEAELEEENSSRVTRQKKSKNTELKASFENFRRKREKFLKPNESESDKVDEKKASKLVEVNGSEEEEEKETPKSRKSRKCIIVSSEEEEEEKKKEETEGKEEEDKEESSSASKAPSSGSSSDEQKKGRSWKRIKDKKGSSNSDTKWSESDGESSKESKKKRKRRKVKENGSNSEVKESGSDSEASEDKKKAKGRKNIKKILKKDSLHVETQEALKNERERMKRLEEKRKLFREIFPEEDEVILDFDPETKEPLVKVHKKLVKKLKPHQKEGVRFMWDSCFESVKRLEEDSGSGCILAHCMGLGKTLQVITLVHTLMNHDLGVNTVLVVCPLSTVSNWLREFESWLEHIHTDPIILYDLVKYKKQDERKYHLTEWNKTGGVLVISYDLFRNLTKDFVKGKETKKLMAIKNALVDPGPDLVVCDEGHLLKNEDTALSKCMSKVKTSRRIVLTGTPLQNNLIEYHCMVQFVKPNILGTRKEFCNRFVNPINNGQFEDSTDIDVKIMKKRSHVLHSMLQGCVQRFDYSVLTPFLPEKHEYVLSVSLTEMQAKAYQHFINNLSARIKGSSKATSLFHDFHSLQRIWTHPKALLMQSDKEIKQKEEADSEGSLKDFIVSTDEDESETSSESSEDNAPPKRKRLLRSNANDPEMQKPDEDEIELITKHWWQDFYKDEDCEDLRQSNKLILLFSLLKHCEEAKDKVLVFSQSLYSLDVIEQFLAKVDENSKEDDETLCGHQGSWVLGADYFRLDGSTSSDMRAIWCKSFNKPSNTRARLFLISTRAGGLGINLFGANRVVIFDASWNPSHDVQSIFRVYRFGQKKPCYIYRFLAEGTMEEKIYERQVAKLSLAHRVVDEHQIERHYSMINLQELYNFEPTPKEKREVPKLPKDAILAELLAAHKDLIVRYHEHDSLLENREEEELSEEERKAAWKEYEEEKLQKTGNSSQAQQQVQALMQQFSQFQQNPILNPAFVAGQVTLGQNLVNPFVSTTGIPLLILQRGLQVGLSPFFNESSESFFNRVIHREKWVQMSKGPRET